LEVPLYSDSRILRQVDTLVDTGFKLFVIELGKSEKQNPCGFQLITIENNPPAGFYRLIPLYLKRAFNGIAGVTKILQEIEPDVIEAIGPLALLSSCKAMKKKHIPIIYNSLELYQENFVVQQNVSLFRTIMRWLYWKLLTRSEKRYINQADAVITVSQTIAKEMRARFSIPEPTVIMNCLSASKRPSPLRGGPDLIAFRFPGIGHRKRLLYSGWLAEGRGIEEVLVALSKIEQAVLIIMGEEAPGQKAFRERVGKMIHSLSLEGRVFFLGMVPANEVLKYAQWADIGILPYKKTCLNNWYSVPNKMFEYLLAGLPVVASFQPEYTKILIENGFGLVFNPNDPDDIARCVNRLIEERETYQKIRNNVLNKAPEYYSWEQESRKYLDIIFRVLG